MQIIAGLKVRTYGTSGPPVIVLHGGPAAAGSAAPVARQLGEEFRAFEPWQRGSSDAALTVARHVADLHALVRTCGGSRPAIVGESWGAMLALAYAAEHPDTAGPLVLIGCGTFDKQARARLKQTLEERTNDELREKLARLEAEYPDMSQRLLAWHDLTAFQYDYEPLQEDEPAGDAEPFDIKAHIETWQDMVRLQEQGLYPAAFSAIRSPVLMLHGTYDPHPGQMIRDSLLPHIPQLEYREWERCGHSPWRERHARDDFYRVLQSWLQRHMMEN